jgi:dienelactone hydrolase
MSHRSGIIGAGSLALLSILCLGPLAVEAAGHRTNSSGNSVSHRAPPSTPLGSGPYAAIMEEADSLPAHTIYRPKDLAALGDRRLPIVAWGNGGCVNDGSSFRWFLSEIASYGFLVIANGPIGADPRTPPIPLPPMHMPNAATLPPPATHTAQLVEAIDWAIAENRRAASPLHGRVATDAIAVMGQSCGGVQAIEAARDPRVKTAMIWNSGLLPQPTAMGGGKLMDKSDLARLHTPVAYISGDAEDIAFANGNDDFARLNHVPAFRAYERGVTHMGTYWEPNGGEFGGVAVAWLLWQLRGDQRAGRMFTGPDCGLCVDPRWVVEKKRIE